MRLSMPVCVGVGGCGGGACMRAHVLCGTNHAHCIEPPAHEAPCHLRYQLPCWPGQVLVYGRAVRPTLGVSLAPSSVRCHALRAACTSCAHPRSLASSFLGGGHSSCCRTALHSTHLAHALVRAIVLVRRSWSSLGSRVCWFWRFPTARQPSRCDALAVAPPRWSLSIVWAARDLSWPTYSK